MQSKWRATVPNQSNDQRSLLYFCCLSAALSALVLSVFDTVGSHVTQDTSLVTRIVLVLRAFSLSRLSQSLPGAICLSFSTMGPVPLPLSHLAIAGVMCWGCDSSAEDGHSPKKCNGCRRATYPSPDCQKELGALSISGNAASLRHLTQAK